MEGAEDNAEHPTENSTENIPADQPEVSENPLDHSENPPDSSENPPDTSENPPDPSENPPDPSENPPDPSENPLDPSENPPDPSENPPDPSENPPDPSENPPDQTEDEENHGLKPEDQPIENESFIEMAAVAPDDEGEEDTSLDKTAEMRYSDVQQEAETEDQENADDQDSRPPPMAPSPAIFYPDDSGGAMPSASLREQFLQDGVFKKETKKDDPSETQDNKAVKFKSATTKRLATYPFRAKMKTDRELYEALQETPPSHEYCGFIYSSVSERPIGGFTNYFLPVYSQPPLKRHVHITGIPIPSEVIHTRKTSQMNVLPLSTVKVTWASGRTRTVYRAESVYAYLTRFGPIDAVYVKSVNSVHVIFCDLEAARSVVSCSQLGKPWDPLIAFWLEPRMYNSSFYYKYAAIENPPQRFRI